MSESARRWVGWLRRLLVLLAVLLVLLGGLVARVVVLGSASLERAERAFDRGELRESVFQARRAATLTAPFAPHVDAAYARLQIIARGAEAADRLRLAAFAWNAVRSAAIESSSPLVPARPELELANKNLARLAARLGAERAEAPDPAAERAILATLQRPPPARELGLVWAGFGLVLLVAGVSLSATLGLKANGSVARRPLLAGIALLVLGVACWTLALYQA